MSRSVNLGRIEGKSLCRFEGEVVDVTSCTGANVDVKGVLACLKIYSTECCGIVICPAGCCKGCIKYNRLAVKLCGECGCRIDLTVTCGVHTNSNSAIVCYGNRPLEVVVAGVGCRYVTDMTNVEATGMKCAFNSPDSVIATCANVTVTSNLFCLFYVNIGAVTLALLCASVLCASVVKALAARGTYTLTSVYAVNSRFVEGKSRVGCKYEVVDIAGCALTDVDIKCILACLKVYCCQAFCGKGEPIAGGNNSINCKLFSVKYNRECLGNANVSIARCIKIKVNRAIILNCNNPLEVVVAGICLRYLVNSANIEVTRCICILNSPDLVIAACCYITVTNNLFRFFHILISTRNLCAAVLFLNESNLG